MSYEKDFGDSRGSRCGFRKERKKTFALLSVQDNKFSSFPVPSTFSQDVLLLSEWTQYFLSAGDLNKDTQSKESCSCTVRVSACGVRMENVTLWGLS